MKNTIHEEIHLAEIYVATGCLLSEKFTNEVCAYISENGKDVIQKMIKVSPLERIKITNAQCCRLQKLMKNTIHERIHLAEIYAATGSLLPEKAILLSGFKSDVNDLATVANTHECRGTC